MSVEACKKITDCEIYPCLAMLSLNSQSAGTAIAQLNLSRNVLEKIFSMGTSFRLHHATEIRGSM